MNESIVQKDQSITLVRVVAMLSIIICHIFSVFSPLAFLSQIFNVGVFTFLFLSGFLFGKKSIDSVINWLVKRAMRILIPMYIFMLFLFVFRLILLRQTEPLSYIVYFLNIQGFVGGTIGGVIGGDHLWFLTAVMLCYFITPLLDRLKPRVINFSKVTLLLCLSMLVVMQIMTSYFLSNLAGVYFGYAIVYVFAYFFGCLWNGNISRKGLIMYTAVTMLSLLLRVAIRYVAHGTFLYANFLVIYTHAVFGIWIFVFICYFKKIASNSIINKITNHLEHFAFEIYIVHYMFIVGSLQVIRLTPYTILNIVLVLVLSYISGVILHKICCLVNNLGIYKKIMEIGIKSQLHSKSAKKTETIM